MPGYLNIRSMISKFSEIRKAAGKIKEPALHELKLLAFRLASYALPSIVIMLCLRNEWLRPETKVPDYISSFFYDSLSLQILFVLVFCDLIVLLILIGIAKIISQFRDKKVRLLGLITEILDGISILFYSFISFYFWAILVLWFYHKIFYQFYRAPFLDAILLSFLPMIIIFIFVLYLKLLVIKLNKVNC